MNNRPPSPVTPKRKSRIQSAKPVFAITLATAILALLMPVTAFAVPESDSPDSLGAHQISPREAQEAVAYWTPERRANATPVEELASVADNPKTTPRIFSAQVAAPLETLAEPIEEAPWTDPNITPTVPVLPDDASITNGKVYFQEWAENDDGVFEWQNFTCSGSAINSPSKSVVATAGHCVHTGGPDGEWVRYWTFYPGYNEGLAPRHTYPATSFFTSQAWLTEQDEISRLTGDIAFVSVGSNPLGDLLVDRVGGHGLQIGGSYSFGANVFGYPGSIKSPNPYVGETQETCSGPTEQHERDGYSFLSLSNCDVKGGGSGGPWLSQYNTETGLGYVRSVHSFLDVNVEGVVHAPYLTQEVKSLFQAADEYRSPWYS